MSELRLTFGWVANVVGGRLTAGREDDEVGPVTSDSRTLRPGDLFVALRGQRFDGHAFVGDVLARGASGAIVDEAWAAGHLASPGLIAVADTLRALQDLARAVRRESGARVVAITGSAGKTTTKEAMAALLSAKYRVVKNKGNLNNHIGLPLSLLQLRTRPDVAVMELGMNHPGEISTLVAIAEPDVRVWTNVGDAHLGFFDSPDAIADAKAEILEDARRDTLLVYNTDDPRITERIGRFSGRTVSFGLSDDADVRATNVEDLGTDGTRAQVVAREGNRPIHSPLLGRGNLLNVLAATAVALEFSVDLDTVAARIARLAPAERRGTVRHLANGISLIDDSYNSSPTALRRALEVVAADRHARRKVAVLGEMLELGEHAVRLHEQCGRAAVSAGIELLFGVGGPPARALVSAAVAQGLQPAAAAYFETSDIAAAAVAAALRAGDLVLVKGSRGIRTDVIADRIVEEHA